MSLKPDVGRFMGKRIENYNAEKDQGTESNAITAERYFLHPPNLILSHVPASFIRASLDCQFVPCSRRPVVKALTERLSGKYDRDSNALSGAFIYWLPLIHPSRKAGLVVQQSLEFDRRSDKYFQDNMWNLNSYSCLIYLFNVAQLIEGGFFFFFSLLSH